jgi:hypothetical protein
MKEEKGRFILEHAGKTLAATIDDAEHLGQNSVYVAGVFLAALSACGAILTSSRDWVLISASIISGVYLLFCAERFVRSSLSAKSIKLPGNLASNFQKPPYSTMGLEELLILEAKGYDERIKVNAERNRLTGNGLNSAIRGILRFPVVFVVVWVAAKIISFAAGSP